MSNAPSISLFTRTVGPKGTSRRRFGGTWLSVLLGAAAGTGAMLLWRPPAPVSEQVSPDNFSAYRAFKHVEIIAARPHRRGTVENASVRDYILAQLRLLGLEPEVRRGVARRTLPLPVENILVRLPGSASTGTVIFSAHYDAAGKAPGAGDNAAAVAALIETARALKHAPPLRNDVVFVFTDGEEEGLLGASALASDTSLLHRGGLLFNFDARGTEGPSIMFETSSPDGELIGHFSRAAPHIVASSLTDAVYRRMQNRTDFTIYRQTGVTGLNFAFIGGGQNYHTAADTADRLSLGTLQHTGDYALGLASYFGGLSLPIQTRGPCVYFTVVPGLFCWYPVWLAAPLAFLVLCCLMAAIYGVIRSGAGRIWTILISIVCLVVTLVAAIGAAWLGQKLCAGFVPRIGCLIGACGFAAMLVVAFAKCMKRWATDAEIFAASCVLWTALTVGTALSQSGASYVFVIPAVFAVLAYAAMQLIPQRGGRFTGWWLHILSCMSATVIIAPLGLLLWQAIPKSVPIVAALVGLVSTLFLPVGQPTFVKTGGDGHR
jgi:hypothetical protein